MSPPPFTSGLVEVTRRVRTYLETHGVSAKVSLGWKERARQSNQGAGTANRVVIIPSDAQGKGGTINQIKSPGPRPLKDETGTVVGHVRGLREWERQLSVAVWAADPARPNDDEATIEATEALFEWVVRAFHSANYTHIEWGSVTWTTAPNETSYGREMVVDVTLSHPIFDLPTETARPTQVAVAGDYEPTP